MPIEIVVALSMFSLSMSLTPGPGNLTLMGISSRFGLIAALPFAIGTSIGVMLIFACASIGLASVAMRYPEIFSMLSLLGAVYLLFLAWRLASYCITSSQTGERLPGYLAGVGVQIVSPKAWIVSVTVVAQFSTPGGNSALIIISIFTVIMTACNFLWAYFGARLKDLVGSPRKMLVVSRCLGGALATSVIYLVAQSL